MSDRTYPVQSTFSFLYVSSIARKSGGKWRRYPNRESNDAVLLTLTTTAMSSFYAHRASYVASWAPRRLFPLTEPSFLDAIPSPPRPTSSSPPPPTSSLPFPSESEDHPPLYFPPPPSSSLSPTAGGSRSSKATSSTITVAWSSHPTLLHGLPRFIRVISWYKCMRGDRESLDPRWPELLSAPTQSGERTSLVLPNVGDNERKDFERLRGLFSDRIGILNTLIQEALVPTRRIVMGLEMINSLWLILLIIALSVDRGRQGVFSEGTEATLVVLIILNGIGVNAVRVSFYPSLSTQMKGY